MRGILDYLEKYNDNITIAQLKEAIGVAMMEEKEREREEVARVKKTFHNIYLKETKDCTIFGKTLNIYHIIEIVNSGRCEDWSLFYHVAGTEMSFTKTDIRYRRFEQE